MTESLTAMLYVPGSDERKLAKIEQLDAAAYILDLEDAVAPQAKGAARRLVAQALARWSSQAPAHGSSKAPVRGSSQAPVRGSSQAPARGSSQAPARGPSQALARESRAQLWVRVNPGATGLLIDDLEAVVVPGLDGIVLPKSESAADVAALDALLGALERGRGLKPGSVRLIATIETAAGLGRVDEIAASSTRIVCLGFGAGDFSLDLGLDWPPEGGLGHTLLTAKAELVLASRRNGLGAPHDGVFPDFRAPDQLRAEAQAARALGFAGKHAIHPDQVTVINEVFEPTAAQVAEAEAVIDAYAAGVREGRGGVHIDGRFIDAPVAERARRVLAASRDGESHKRDEPAAAPAPVALQGIRVLDLSSLYAAPLIAMNLGDFGAEVIKVEHPRGDDARRWGLAKDGVPLWWKTISRNKRVIALDLSQEADRDVVRELAARADVLIENFRPGRLERWGLSPDDLHAINPGLVIARVTGFGQTGPYRQRPGFGTLAEAFSGFAHMTGLADGPPTLPPFGLADAVCGLAGTYAVLTALYWRDAAGGGEGQVIDLSLYEPLFSALGPQVTEFNALGVVQNRQGNRSPRTSPRNAYETADGRWVAISGGTQQIADRVMAAVDRPELAGDPRFSSAAARRENADELDALVADWIRQRPLDVVLERFESSQAPIAPVYDASQILDDPHYRERGSFVRCPDPDLGEVTIPGIVARLSRTPGSIRWTGPAAIGADTDEVLAELLERRSSKA
jgi:crotonobetainyl-CoA:carnitine CoA-transferase CaiB-like acyl-CoA transferase/citrate lyase beta subunit